MISIVVGKWLTMRYVEPERHICICTMTLQRLISVTNTRCTHASSAVLLHVDAGKQSIYIRGGLRACTHSPWRELLMSAGVCLWEVCVNFKAIK